MSSKKLSIFNFQFSIPQRGFTVMELLVVIGIATVIMTALVIQQSKWNDHLTVSTQAYELALMVRQAQIFSLGVREYAAGAGDKFDVGYGIYFDSDHSRYIFFADSNRDGRYSPNEAVETKAFTRGVAIDRICGRQGGGEVCSSPLEALSVSFLRPDPKANLAFLDSWGSQISGFYPPAVVYLKSSGGKVSSVKVDATGQVSITQ